MTKIASNIYQNVKSFIVKHRRIAVTIVYILQATLANYLAFVLRFDLMLPRMHLKQMFSYLPVLLAIRLVFYLQAGLYKDLWRYASISDLIRIMKSATLGSVAFLITVRYVIGDITYPRSIYVFDCLLLILISGGSRLFIRIFREYLQSEYAGNKKALIIGAGDAGETIVRDMKNNPKSGYEPIGFIDNDPYKKGLSIHGVPIFGPINALSKIIEKHKPEEIIICMPSARHKTIKEIYEICKPFNVSIKTLPGISDMLNGKVSISQIKPLSFEELLQREPVRTNIQSVKEYIEGKTVMITGAGGSIGSELSRQIVEYGPSELILLDRYENSLFYLNLELEKKQHSTTVSTIIGDILDAPRLEHVFSTHKPQIVFHAAAHKHVPLMELNPIEAIKNNIFGTKNLLEASARHGAENFIMISTDKAVNPTSIMGTTKRVAEFLTISMNSTCSTKFTTVRFGNVLGSNGSVIHIFKEQIKQGGPLTVTHPEIRRFFMLIHEAVQLVLIAAAAGEGGEIFVLDMGEPIKIVDFAENVIRLSGFVPHKDIRIEFTGLRPGEKLYEELFDESEEVLPTFHEKLRKAVPKIPPRAELSQYISELERIVQQNSTEEIIPLIQKIVPNFKRQLSI
jgi:FlaA1/EpsC-like NDP-sugar epimerase